MSPADLVVPTFVNLLRALSSWLAKAEGGDDVLLARLAHDMFPLSTQVRFACVQAYEATARLSGQPVPPLVEELLNEGRDAGEHPGSMAQAQARIAATLAMLEGLAPGALDMAPDAPIAHELSNGMIFDFTAEEYARDWALGQFYFHVMTAYAILRSQGVPLGKVDYVPHMLPKMRA